MVVSPADGLRDRHIRAILRCDGELEKTEQGCGLGKGRHRAQWTRRLESKPLLRRVAWPAPSAGYQAGSHRHRWPDQGPLCVQLLASAEHYLALVCREVVCETTTCVLHRSSPSSLNQLKRIA